MTLPNSYRFCKKCQNTTKFVFDPKLGHSRCNVCQSTSQYAINTWNIKRKEIIMLIRSARSQIDIAEDKINKFFDENIPK